MLWQMKVMNAGMRALVGDVAPRFNPFANDIELRLVVADDLDLPGVGSWGSGERLAERLGVEHVPGSQMRSGGSRCRRLCGIDCNHLAEPRFHSHVWPAA